MAFTLANNQTRTGPVGGRADLRYIFEVTGPASYTNTGTWATSGEATNFGITVERLASFTIDNGAGTFRIVTYDYTTGRLHAFVPNTGAEVANGVDLSTFTGRLEVTGY